MDPYNDPINCVECGSELKLTFGEGMNQELLNGGVCFNCNFWRKRLMEYHHSYDMDFGVGGVYVDNYARCVTISNESQGGGKWSGFAGRQFILQHEETCEILYTTNMWSRGIVPKLFFPQMPPNIIYLEEEITFPKYWKEFMFYRRNCRSEDYPDGVKDYIEWEKEYIEFNSLSGSMPNQGK